MDVSQRGTERDRDAVDDIIASGRQKLRDLFGVSTALRSLIALALEPCRHRRRTKLVVLGGER